MQTPLRTLTSTATDFADFNATASSCVIFCEADNRLLFLHENAESQAGRWALPGGNLRNDETPIAAAMRLFREQTPIQVNDGQLEAQGRRFARISGIDSIIHFFKVNFDKKPQEAADLLWISIFALPILDQILNLESGVPGRAEAFDVIYRHRFWQRIEDRSVTPKSLTTAAKFVFQKENQTLEFDATRKLIITVIGTAGSGKNTQGQLLEWALGMASTSDGEIMQNESDTPLSKMVAAFDQKYPDLELPSELHLGMMARRLSQPDCSSGIILRGFPSSETQCDVFLSIFVRSTDCLLPIFLDISDEDVKKRLVQDHTGEMRLARFQRTKDGILHKLADRSVIQTLPLTRTIQKLDVFHLVYSAVQKTFDELALAQQQAELQRRMPSNEVLQQRIARQSPASSTSRALIFFGSVAAVAGLGYLWIKNKN